MFSHKCDSSVLIWIDEVATKCHESAKNIYKLLENNLE